MDIETFRNYCLSFPGVEERMPFLHTVHPYNQSVLCFYVGGKWFCWVNIDLFDFCCLKSTPEESAVLQERYGGVQPGWHMNKKHWISVFFNQDVPDTVIEELVKKSYEHIFSRLSREKRNSIKLLSSVSGRREEMREE